MAISSKFMTMSSEIVDGIAPVRSKIDFGGSEVGLGGMSAYLTCPTQELKIVRRLCSVTITSLLHMA
jgi:hypothetical protein